jgi:hypothetical protein
MFLITPMRLQKQYWYSVRQDIDHSYVMFYYPNSKSISTKELQKGGSVEFGYRPLQNYDICMTMHKTKNELCMLQDCGHLPEHNFLHRCRQLLEAFVLYGQD